MSHMMKAEKLPLRCVAEFRLISK